MQESGAIGLVIMNEKPLRWEEDELVRMGEDEKNAFNAGNGGACEELTTIPSVFVSYESGSALLALARNGSVLVDINAWGEYMGWNGE